jgi:hypothetical protein
MQEPWTDAGGMQELLTAIMAWVSRSGVASGYGRALPRKSRLSASPSASPAASAPAYEAMVTNLADHGCIA